MHSDSTMDVCGPNTTASSDQYATWSNEIYNRLFYYQLGHSIFATLMFVVTLCGESEFVVYISARFSTDCVCTTVVCMCVYMCDVCVWCVCVCTCVMCGVCAYVMCGMCVWCVVCTCVVCVYMYGVYV